MGSVTKSIVDTQRGRAVEVLLCCSHATGIKGSGARVGHHQVWARDSMITALGALTLGDPIVEKALRASLETLRRNQSHTGAIPNHVDVVSGKPNFRAYADGGLWYVVGNCLLAPSLPSVMRLLRWYSCQDVDNTGLISIQEASDWQDLFCTHGKGLYVNCLHVIALKHAAALAESRGRVRLAARYRSHASAASFAIRQRFWYAGDGHMLRHVSHTFSTEDAEADSLGRRRWLPSKRILADEHYFLAYLGFREVGEWFDALGNLMAILSGVAGAEQSAHILDFIARHNLGRYPIQAIYPAIQPGEAHWRDYYGQLNLPGHYHNGGIWPFIGGFYIAALVKAGRRDEAAAALYRLAELNRDGEFCEWHHGVSAEPLGVRRQAWSAGMFLFAAECVATNRVPFL
jgi:glycogen debranching enzyme